MKPLSFAPHRIPRRRPRPHTAAVAFAGAELAPPRGWLGLLDWYACAQFSRRQVEGFFSGALGEPLLFLSERHLPFAYTAVVGIGGRESFDRSGFDAAVQRTAHLLSDLGATEVTMALPGRDDAWISPEQATTWLLESADALLFLDRLTIVDSPSALPAMHTTAERWKLLRDLPFAPALTAGS